MENCLGGQGVGSWVGHIFGKGRVQKQGSRIGELESGTQVRLAELKFEEYSSSLMPSQFATVCFGLMSGALFQ